MRIGKQNERWDKMLKDAASTKCHCAFSQPVWLVWCISYLHLRSLPDSCHSNLYAFFCKFHFKVTLCQGQRQCTQVYILQILNLVLISFFFSNYIFLSQQYFLKNKSSFYKIEKNYSINHTCEIINYYHLPSDTDRALEYYEIVRNNNVLLWFGLVWVFIFYPSWICCNFKLLF